MVGLPALARGSCLLCMLYSGATCSECTFSRVSREYLQQSFAFIVAVISYFMHRTGMSRSTRLNAYQAKVARQSDPRGNPTGKAADKIKQAQKGTGREREQNGLSHVWSSTRVLGALLVRNQTGLNAELVGLLSRHALPRSLKRADVCVRRIARNNSNDLPVKP